MDSDTVTLLEILNKNKVKVTLNPIEHSKLLVSFENKGVKVFSEKVLKSEIVRLTFVDIVFMQLVSQYEPQLILLFFSCLKRIKFKIKLDKFDKIDLRNFQAIDRDVSQISAENQEMKELISKLIKEKTFNVNCLEKVTSELKEEKLKNDKLKGRLANVELEVQKSKSELLKAEIEPVIKKHGVQCEECEKTIQRQAEELLSMRIGARSKKIVDRTASIMILSSGAMKRKYEKLKLKLKESEKESSKLKNYLVWGILVLVLFALAIIIK